MSSYKQHCADCIELLGEPFGQVHQWLDEHFGNLGPSHRDIRHHAAGVGAVRRMWGDKAAEAAKIHIMEDVQGTIPSLKQAKMWSVFSRKASAILEEEFPEGT